MTADCSAKDLKLKVKKMRVLSPHPRSNHVTMAGSLPLVPVVRLSFLKAIHPGVG